MTIASQSQFAAAQGWSRSYVTQLKQAGRLVLQDGQVDVEASLARIAETADTNRDDVAARHAAARQAQAASDTGTSLVDEKVSATFREFRARKMRADAEKAELERDQLQGKLVLASDVARAGGEAGTYLNTALFNAADRLAPELAPETDALRVHALLVETFESVLEEFARRLETLAEASGC